jgi:hypothetical protein
MIKIGSAAMERPHQAGQSDFRSILPEEIDWKLFPAFPPSARLSVVVGEPTAPGPYVIRVKVASGVKLMPHLHPAGPIVAAISGYEDSRVRGMHADLAEGAATSMDVQR